jgi:uncharacterized surface protein with fasciclin (FAS1) repeats
MHHLLIKGFAAALVMGAGAGAVTDIGGPKPDVPRDVLNPMIDGQAMLTGATIYDNACKSPEHTRFVADIKAAGLVPLLSGSGSYTVFAPTNAAYASQSRSGADDKALSARDVGYLIVPGRYDSQTLLGMINAKGGEVKLKTVEGGTLTAMLNGPTNIALVDERGQVADISIYDVYQKNGVIQVIDNVLRPAGGTKIAARS